MEFLNVLLKEKTIIAIAGPNGSGKTTFAKTLLADIGPSIPFLNADEFAKKIQPEDPEKAAFRAGRMYIEQRNKFLSENRSIVIETTFAGKDMARFFKEIKAKNYKLFIIYIFLPTSRACIARIQTRVKGGGHYIPDSIVKRRFNLSHKNFWTQLRTEADNWAILYNGAQAPLLVAEGAGNSYTVYEDHLFCLFKGNLK